MEDPEYCEERFWNSNLKSGVCLGKTPEGVNEFGVIVFLICVGLAIVTRTKQALYLVSTLQSLALISFVEVAWINPASYLLQSMQYLMIFNLMARDYKEEDDYSMLQRQYYRLDDYYVSSKMVKNLIPIFVIGILVFIGIVIFICREYRARKQA